jgi:hypothetical protein
MRGALMGFYYGSLFSLIPLGIAYVAMALVFWGVAVGTRGIQRRRTVLVITALVLLVLPISEELWIAWNFRQACKDAGKFVYKKVVADGFYDDTAGWGPRQLRESQYQFVESKDVLHLHRKISRVESLSDSIRDQTLARYSSKGEGKQPLEQEFVEFRLSDAEQIYVARDRTRTWRVTMIERPTARYHYIQPAAHKPVAHKVRRNERQVVDVVEKDILAREVNVAREAPWYYVSLDRPLMLCYGRQDPSMRGSIYTHALLPTKEGK